MIRIRNLLTCAVALLAIALGASGATAQSEAPSATISIETTTFAAGMGLSWGNGKLVFGDREYRFSVEGMTFMDIGMSKVSAAGLVYNLTDLADFEGQYVAAEAHLALGGGMGSMALKNQNGVVMRLRSVSQGARFQLGASGMSISLW